MVTHSGPSATTGCEPRQARKGATVAADSGAGVWLVWVATRRGVRAVEGARLESVCTETYRGFESLPLRQNAPRNVGLRPPLPQKISVLTSI
jgi:hypothetical protein